MTNAAITGWGACMPPAVLTNVDLATFLDTDDAWITSRTGMKERRVSHVPAIELATVASRRAIACAGLEPADIDLVLYGSCSNGEQVPNSASGVQAALGATRAAAMDINTACTSFLYSLSTASAMIRTGIVRRAVVIGVELISPYMDWRNRNVAVLFGDGCAAVVLEPAEGDEGLLGEQLGCDADGRASLRVRGIGCVYANRDVAFGDTLWDFNGQENLPEGGAGDEPGQRGGARAVRRDARPGRSRGAAPGEPADHRGGGRPRRHPDGQGDAHRPALRQHECRHGARGAGRGARDRPRAPRRAGADAGVRRGADLLRALGALGKPGHAAGPQRGGVAAEPEDGA